MYAQTTDSTKTKNYRNHIGLNTQFAQDGFFNPNARTPLQLMYKRQNKKNTGAWRIGLGIFYSVTDDSNAIPKQVSFYAAYRGLHYDWRGHFSLGYEWQKTISPKWKIYYGIDSRIAWDYQKFVGEETASITLNGGSPNISTGFDEKYVINLALKPFIGLRLQLSKRCYLATEALLQVHYENNQQNIRFYTRAGTLGKGDINYRNYGYSLKPYSGVYLFYLL
jgi:hypothetical protein